MARNDMNGKKAPMKFKKSILCANREFLLYAVAVDETGWS
jgi:hypothetical protein